MLRWLQRRLQERRATGSMPRRTPDPKDQVIVKAILFATVLGTSLSAREIAEFIARREVTEEEWPEKDGSQNLGAGLGLRRGPVILALALLSTSALAGPHANGPLVAGRGAQDSRPDRAAA